MRATNRPFALRRALLFVALSTAVTVAAFPQTAGAHRSGSWMVPQEVMLRIEARGFDLAMCKGRGAVRYRGIPDVSYAAFRHFECVATMRSGAMRAFCVHTLPRKRLRIVPQRLGRVCRF